jgi:Domain of unknown function (DUF4836)
MSTPFRLTLLAALSVLVLASCKKTNKEGRFIPKDAAIAVHVNGASLSAKLPWEEVKQNALFQQMYADTAITGFIKKALDNPENSGIDTKTDMLFFAQKDSSGGIVAFTGTIKDAEKFKLFNLDITKGGSESERDGVNYISKYPMCVAWNKEKFVYITDAPQLNQQDYMRSFTDTGYNTTATPKARDLGITCKNIFDLKESNSLGEDEKFTTLLKKAGDIHFWMNAEQLNKGGITNAALSMINLSKLYEGNITTATVNFENGKILIDTKSYANKEMTAVYKKMGGKNIDEDMIKRLPAKEVAAVFAMSYKPEGIKDFLKVLGVEGYANMGLAFAGFSMDDFIKANKGDVLIAVTDLKQKNAPFVFNDEPKSADNSFTQPDIIFATSIGDKEAFNLLIKAAEKFGKSAAGDLPIAYNSDGKHFVLGNSKENIAKFSAGPVNNFDFLSKINGHPFGGYINMQFILKSIESSFGKDSSAKVFYDASVKLWDNIYMKGGDYEDGGMVQNIQIDLMDKNTNSLKQLNQYLGLVSKIKMENDKKRDISDLKLEELNEGNINFPPPALPKSK